jgi:hypothetical protein
MSDPQGDRDAATDTDLIFLVGPDGSLTRASSSAYEAEADLQKLLADNIDLLPGAQINPANPRRWLLIKREAGVSDHEGGGGWWSVDHLAVDQDAIPTFVEVKRASDTRSRREVVAQMLDYAANGSVFWTPELLRDWFEGSDPPGATERVVELLGPTDGEPDEVADAFWQKVGTNLREGQIRLVFVADEIPASLKRLVEFLNEQMSRVEVLALEIRQYRADDNASGALVPRLIGQTSRAQDTKERPVSAPRRSARWTTEEVMAAVAEAGHEAVAVSAAVRDWALANPHVEIVGGVGVKDRGFTVTADTGPGASRRRPLLSLYSSPFGGPPMLEIQVRLMRTLPPYDRAGEWAALMASIRALGIPRLASEPAFAGIRPNIPVEQLTGGRVQRLLALVEQWLHDVRTHAGVQAPADEDPPEGR